MHNHKVIELVIECVSIRSEDGNNSNFGIWKEEKVLGHKAALETVVEVEWCRNGIFVGQVQTPDFTYTY